MGYDETLTGDNAKRDKALKELVKNAPVMRNRSLSKFLAPANPAEEKCNEIIEAVNELQTILETLGLISTPI